jgi:hypothetical protein
MEQSVAGKLETPAIAGRHKRGCNLHSASSGSPSSKDGALLPLRGTIWRSDRDARPALADPAISNVNWDAEPTDEITGSAGWLVRGHRYVPLLPSRARSPV